MSERFAELFEESFASQQIKPGSIIKGTVVAVNDDVVIVSAGLKSEAVIPIEQFRNDMREGEISVGDEVEVALDAVEDGFGETRLSREKAIRARTWTELEKAFEDGEVVEGVINGRVKGGFTVEIDNVRAFLPGSLVDVRPVRDPAYLEGKSLEFKVIKLDQRRNNVVVSRRAVVEQEYDLEYGTDKLQLHADAVADGERVLIVDDVLATGGTAAASIDLLRQVGADVVGLAVLLELEFLHGRQKIDGVPVHAVVRDGAD